MKKSKESAFTAVAKAVGDYLEAVGYRALVIGSPRIEQPHGSRPMNYEFVLRFTGGKKSNATTSTARKRTKASKEMV